MPLARSDVPYTTFVVTATVGPIHEGGSWRPGGKINTPEHWRQRADEMRALAAAMDDGDAKSKLLKLAADYESLAERAAKRSDRPTAYDTFPRGCRVRRGGKRAVPKSGRSAKPEAMFHP